MTRIRGLIGKSYRKSVRKGDLTESQDVKNPVIANILQL